MSSHYSHEALYNWVAILSIVVRIDTPLTCLKSPTASSTEGQQPRFAIANSLLLWFKCIINLPLLAEAVPTPLKSPSQMGQQPWFENHTIITAPWSCSACYVSATMHDCAEFMNMWKVQNKRDTFLPGKGKVQKKLLLCPKNIYILLCVELTLAKTDHKYFINTNYLKK